MKRRQLLIALNAAARITRAALCRLARDTATWSRANDGDAETRDLARRLGVPGEQLRRALAVRRQAVATAEREESRVAQLQGRILTLADEDYPSRLLDLALPPPVLYVRGRIPDGPAIAIVGSRRTDAYGRESAEYFAGRLAQAGVTVVSGFARGIDSISHEAALAAPGGLTVAVLGAGLDVDYPRGQRELGDAIADRGAMVTELRLGAEPRPWHFPIRNRVIAALAEAVLVVQARPRSGSLITAHHALELGRDVFAVPGRIFDDLSIGTNALVADGAYLARHPDDLLEAFALARQGELFPGNLRETAATSPLSLSPLPAGTAGRILRTLPEDRGRTAEDVAVEVGVTVDQVVAALLELELGGWVRREPGPLYVRCG